MEIRGRSYWWKPLFVQLIQLKRGRDMGILVNIGFWGLPVIHFAGRDVPDKVWGCGGGEKVIRGGG